VSNYIVSNLLTRITLTQLLHYQKTEFDLPEIFLIMRLL